MSEGIGNAFSTLWEWLTSIVDAILGLPSLIIDGIKFIFIPDFEQIKEDFQYMVDSIAQSFGIPLNGLEEFKNGWSDTALSNVEKDYNISGVGTLKLKFFDASYLLQGIEYFKPLIRGFIVFLLLLYNYHQILSFIGQDPRIMANAKADADAHKKGGGE